VYAPPRANLDRTSPTLDAESRKLRRHERSIRAVGWLHLLGAGLALLSVLVIALQDLQSSIAVMVLVMLAICALHVWIGLGLIRLDRRVRAVAGLIHGIGLLGIPIGTLINGYILYLLFCEMGERAFAAEKRVGIQ
jgi:hypothetical protein